MSCDYDVLVEFAVEALEESLGREATWEEIEDMLNDKQCEWEDTFPQEE
jgi:hypothetical protein